MAAIKPCPVPWCGSTDVEHRVLYYARESMDTPDHFVACNQCSTFGPSRCSQEEATEAWNDRPASVPAPMLKEWFSKTEQAGYFDDWPAYLVQHARDFVVKAEMQEGAMNRIEESRLEKRERETEAWVRSKDADEIVMRLHELEYQIAGLEAKIEFLEEAERQEEL